VLREKENKEYELREKENREKKLRDREIKEKELKDKKKKIVEDLREWNHYKKTSK